nr:mediator of RNA polymerase II transcription subunit 4 isoform X1 [Vicugna pacos]
MAASSSGEKEKERPGGGSGAAGGNSTRERLLSALEDLEVLSRELIEMLAISRNQKLLQSGEENQVLELLIHRDGEFQELMKLALNQGKIHHEMQVLEKEVEKRDSDIQQLQKQLKEAEQILATAVYQAKEKLKSIEKARKGAISSEEIIKYAHRISASNAVCAPLTWVPGDPRRPYPTDLEMRSGLLGQMNNPSTNGVNGHLPGDALAAGRLPGSQGDLLGSSLWDSVEAYWGTTLWNATDALHTTRNHRRRETGSGREAGSSCSVPAVPSTDRARHCSCWQRRDSFRIQRAVGLMFKRQFKLGIIGM